MTLVDFLQESVSVLAATVVVVFVSARLRVPAVVGLVLSGVLIGPFGLGLIAESEEVEIFAEIGVVLLLFTIGVELSLTQMRELRRPFLIGGSVQSGLTMLLVGTAAFTLGRPAANATFIAFVAALSSTAVVLKLYGQRRETRTPQGRLTLAILLFQDVLIVPLIVIVPLLAGAGEADPAALVKQMALALLAVVVLFAVSLRLVPMVFHQLARTRVRELSVLAALLFCLAAAWLTYALGFSLALGAFIAGLVISESEHSHQVIADVVPFRDVFASLFFVSIGMLVDVRFLLAHLGTVLAVAFGLILLKTLAAGVAVLAVGYPVRVALIVGLSLAQVGEFSFLLMEVGRHHGLLDESGFQRLLIASVLTLIATPFLIRAAPPLANRFSDLLPRGGPPPETGGSDSPSGHVVVIGHGMCGSLLARVLKETHIPFLAVEIDPDCARAARAAGIDVVVGDATRPEILESARIEQAAMAVVAISDAAASRRTVRLARTLCPDLELLVRTRQVDAISELRRLGADQVVAEEFETAIEIFTRVLQRLHVPRNVVRAQTRALRGDDYLMLRMEAPEGAASSAVLDALEAGTTDLFRVVSDGPIVGRTLRELDLRQRSGASVIAVVRGEDSLVNPSPELELEASDCLVLVGSHEEIQRAFEVLEHRN